MISDNLEKLKKCTLLCANAVKDILNDPVINRTDFKICTLLDNLKEIVLSELETEEEQEKFMQEYRTVTETTYIQKNK
jgi:hypothetical protein